jgi:hypothetical protein
MALRHLTHEALEEFTHLDGKIWRTLRALLFQPGLLTKEYWEGRRGRWVRPIRLYLVISALTLLLAASAAGPLGLRIWVHQQHGNTEYSIGKQPAAGVLIDHEITHRVQSVYLWARYISVALFAGVSLLLYRKRQRYYGAHLIFAIQFFTFEYVMNGALARAWPDAHPAINVWIGLIYLFLALRRIHRQGWVLTAAKTFLLFFSVAFSELLVLGGAMMYVAGEITRH